MRGFAPRADYAAICNVLKTLLVEKCACLCTKGLAALRLETAFVDKLRINTSVRREALVSGWKQCTGLLWVPASQPGWEACRGAQRGWNHLPAAAGSRPHQHTIRGHGHRGLDVAGCSPCLLRRLLGRRERWEEPAGISDRWLQAHAKVMENNLNAVPAPDAGELQLLDLIQVRSKNLPLENLKGAGLSSVPPKLGSNN